MKIGYILAVLFFPLFLFIDVAPTEKSAVMISEARPVEKINISYNFREDQAEQTENPNAADSPKNTSYTNQKMEETNVSSTVALDESEVIETKQTKTESKIESKTESKTESKEISENWSFDHSSLNRILSVQVSNTGKVNYKGLKSQQKELDSYLKLLSENSPQSNWSKKEQLAFWINAYNAFTLKLIVDNYPIKSITNLDNGKPWDRKWIKIGAKTYSLNNIENDIIRVQFDEPRIHFAVNCAAQSCPPLWNKAWTASNLEANLEKQTRSFINNNRYNQISENRITVSKIFDWYKEDFGNLISYLNKYSTTSISKDAEVNFMEYDWSLNE